MQNQFSGLFVNCKKAKDSIFESGYMVYECLKLSKNYQLDYIEIEESFRTIPTGYHFYFFNYHPITTHWLDTRKLKKELGFVITMVLEVAPADPFVMCPENDFDAYCVLDPTIKPTNKVYVFPRPLEKITFPIHYTDNLIPVIGTFGFSTKGKGFQHVVEAVNKEFEKAIIRINIPYGDYVPDSDKYAVYLGNLCKQKAKPGIEVKVTHDYMSKEELIKWCAENTLNCFLYDRQMPGLAATTDQAIVSGRPLAVSKNDTFRHITKYIKPYPAYSLRESIDKSGSLVNKMKEDWSPEKFCEKFEKLIQERKKELFTRKKIFSTNNYELPVLKHSFSLKLRKKKIKMLRKLKQFIGILPKQHKPNYEII